MSDKENSGRRKRAAIREGNRVGAMGGPAEPTCTSHLVGAGSVMHGTGEVGYGTGSFGPPASRRARSPRWLPATRCRPGMPSWMGRFMIRAVRARS